MLQNSKNNMILVTVKLFLVAKSYLNFDVFIRQFLLLLRLFSFAPLLLSSLPLFLLPLPFLFKFSSSPLLSLLLSYSLQRKTNHIRKIIHMFYSHLSFFFHSYLFLNFLIFDVLQQWCCPFGWNHKKASEVKQMLRLAAAFKHLNLETYNNHRQEMIICAHGTVPMSSLVLASISPSRVSGLAIDFSSSQE